MNRSRSFSWAGIAIVGCVCTAIAVSGCGSSSSSTGTSGSTSATTNGAGSENGPQSAAVQKAETAGTQPPDSSPRKVAEGKKVAIIVLSLDESSATPAHAVEEAAKELGWETRVFNANHEVPRVTALVRQAVAAGYEGIVPVAVDCDFAGAAFTQAKKEGIDIVPIEGVDCNSPISPAKGPSGFSAEIKTATPSTAAFWEQAGEYAADEVIADSGNQAKIISVENQELGVLNGMAKGFTETIENSNGSEIVEKVVFTTPDYISGRVTEMVRAALTKNPDATYIKSPFSAVTAQYIVPAVKSSHSEVKIVGGEGLASELALLREGSLLSTTSTPATWMGWAAIDTLNSVFEKTPPMNSNVPWVLVAVNNVPKGGEVTVKADYKAAYLKAWGR